MRKFLVLVLVFGFSLLSFSQYYGGNNPYEQYKTFNPQASSQPAKPYSVNYPQSVFKPKIFGIGGTVPVIDVKAIYQAIKTYEKLKQEYIKVKQKYELALKMARFIQNMPERYRVIFAKFRKIKNPDDFFNQVDGFIRAYNGEIQDTNALMDKIDQIYKKSTTKLSKDDFNYITEGDLVNPEDADSIKKFVAQINLMDNTNKMSLAAITQANSIQQQLEEKIKNLDGDSLSNSEDLNSEIAVLNKINASLVILVKQQKQINNLLVAMLQQEFTKSIRNREGMAEGQVIENYKKSVAEEKIREYENEFSLSLGQ